MREELDLQWAQIDESLLSLETEVGAFASQTLDGSRFNYALVKDAMVMGIDNGVVAVNMAEAFIKGSDPLGTAFALADEETREIVNGLLTRGGKLYASLKQELPTAIEATLKDAGAMELGLARISLESEQSLSTGRSNPVMTPAEKQQLENDYVTLKSRVEGMGSYMANMTQAAADYSSRIEVVLSRFNGQWTSTR